MLFTLSSHCSMILPKPYSTLELHFTHLIAASGVSPYMETLKKPLKRAKNTINMSLKSPQNRSERLLPVVMQLTEELRRLVELHLLGLRQLAAISSSPTCVSVIRSSNSFLRFAFSTSKSTKIDGKNT